MALRRLPFRCTLSRISGLHARPSLRSRFSSTEVSSQGPISSPPVISQNTVDQQEISKFVRMSSEWWDPHGKFGPLHALNPTRIQFIRDRVKAHYKLSSPSITEPLQGVKLLDIGCGGGLVSEPLARLGAVVTGVDAAAENIRIASLHQQLDPKLLDGRLTYAASTVEDLAQQNQQFDVVVALEIIEHVQNPSLFLQSCASVLKPGGAFFLSTFNRNLKSYLLGVVAAEHVLRWLPPGTHDWNKFFTPSEITGRVNSAGLRIRDLNGIVYDPVFDKWNLSLTDIDVNYILYAVKE